MNNDPLNKRKLSVDELNEKLYYDKDGFKQRPRRTIHDKSVELDHEFPDDEFELWKNKKNKRKLPTSFYRKVFFGVFIFFLLTLVVAALTLYKGKKTVSGDRVSMEILGQPFIDGGESLKLQVRIQNFNEQPLELPDLVLAYPKDSRNEDELTFMRRSLDDVPLNGQIIEEFDVTLFGQEGEVRNLKATLEYRIPGSSAIFLKDAEHEVIIRSTPSILSLEAPSEIVRGQEIALNFNVYSNSNQVINNGLVTIDYPDGFEVISTSPSPTVLNNTWAVPFLRSEKQEFTVIGKLSALEGQAQSFEISYGKRNDQRQGEIETVFNNMIHTVEVQKPFITADLRLNRSDNQVVSIRGGQEVSGEINISNTLDDTLQDVAISMIIDGNLYNPLGIRSQGGFFDSNTKTITWDKGTLSTLSSLQPGETRTLSFNLPTQELIGRTGSLTKPELAISINVSGVESNGMIRTAKDVSSASVIANSDLQLTGNVSYLEGPFQNYGPMPPVVNQETSYTLTLDVINSSNSVEDAELRFFLPSYVTWNDAIAPSVERNAVSYNQTTREVVWSLGKLRPGLGINESKARTLSFQVKILPSLSQRGDQVDLTSDIVLKGIDTFTGTELLFRKTALENRLTNSQEQGASGQISG